VFVLIEDTLGEVTGLLKDALQLHRAIRCVVLATKEGVVVASVSRDEENDPRLLSTVSAALSWAGSTTLSQIGNKVPSYLIHSTPVERILTFVQPHYHLVLVVSRADDSGFDMNQFRTSFQSLLTRIEILMGAHSEFGKETILGRIVKSIPQINQAMVLTQEGMPLGSVGFDNDVEVAALTSSIFSNGLTFSPQTNYISVNAEDINLLVMRIDEKRLLVAVCKGPSPEILSSRVRDFVTEMI